MMLEHQNKICYDDKMRTTLTLDDDLVHDIRKMARKLKKPFKVLLNETLRVGLKNIVNSQLSKTYRTKPVAMKIREGSSLDNIQEILADLEGEDYK